MAKKASSGGTGSGKTARAEARSLAEFHTKTGAGFLEKIK